MPFKSSSPKWGLCAKGISLLLEAPLLSELDVMRNRCSFQFLLVNSRPSFIYPSFSSTTDPRNLQHLQSHHQMQRQQLSKSYFTTSQYCVRSKINPSYHFTQSNFASLVKSHVIHKTFYYLNFTNKVPKHEFLFWRSDINQRDFVCVCIYQSVREVAKKHQSSL